MHLKGCSHPARRPVGHVRGGSPMEMSGLFDFLGKTVTTAGKAAATVTNPLTSLAQQAIQVKSAIDATKLSWKGIPYAVNEQGLVVPATIPAGTEQRLVPQTTAVAQTSGGASATKNDNLSKAEILTIQKQLKAKGFDPGPLDGLYGPKTSAGIKAFQKANGLPQTGAATYDLLQRLSYVAPVQTSAPNPTAIPNNPSAPIASSPPQAPVYTPAVPYYSPPPQVVQVPAQGGSGLPSWAIPVAVGGVGLLMVVMMGGR